MKGENSKGVLSIEFGALSKPISEQLKAQDIKISEDAAKRFDGLADALIMLHLNHIIPDSVRDKARERIMGQIVKEIQS